MVFVWANFTTTLTFLDLHTSSHPYPGVYSNIFPVPYIYVLPGNLLDIDSGMHFSSSIWHSWHSVRHFFWRMYVLDVWWSNCAQEKMSSMHPEHSKIQSMHFETNSPSRLLCCPPPSWKCFGHTLQQQRLLLQASFLDLPRMTVSAQYKYTLGSYLSLLSNVEIGITMGSQEFAG